MKWIRSSLVNLPVDIYFSAGIDAAGIFGEGKLCSR
ncbi:MAG: hypothetical protein JWQ87_4458 [Candidatus Sulfotelmatobacter sp.]|nr:hypothetical protein [Candidatus Sulfotelmatobacter sp.]